MIEVKKFNDFKVSRKRIIQFPTMKPVESKESNKINGSNDQQDA